LKTLVIIVNYKSAPLTLNAVQSVLGSDSIGPVHVVVVDNSENPDEARTLRLNLPSTVSLTVNPENVGFGRACNRAFEAFGGELILLLNPDARLLPGCLLRLQQTLLSMRGVGAVSPQIYWDDGLQFYLPPPIPFFLFQFQTMYDANTAASTISRLLSRIWRYHSIKVWRSRRPIRVQNLPGGLVLLQREAVLKTGPLFDPRFFLYFEDADLFIRLRKAGYALAIEPRAKGIHYYDGTGRSELESKKMMMARSRALFLEKHGNRLKRHLKEAAGRFLLPANKRQNPFPERPMALPFEVNVPDGLRKAWLFEWSPNPDLIPSAGRFGKGSIMRFDNGYWDQLNPGQYFGRLGRPKGFETHFVKFSWRVEDSTPLECNGAKQCDDRVERFQGWEM
jgi:GT2 family glycosyltransferase